MAVGFSHNQPSSTLEKHALVEAILSDDFLEGLPPNLMNGEWIEKLLRSSELKNLDLMAVAKMDLQELISRMLIDGLEVKPEETLEEIIASQLPSEPLHTEEAKQRIAIFIDALAVEAKIMLSEPAEGQSSPSETEIYQALSARGIVSGIKEVFVERLAAFPVYERRFKIAEGQSPINGEDGKVIFHFDTSVELTPNVQADGMVDYKELDFAKNVKKGDVLCELIAPTPGQDGRSIFGGSLPAHDGRPIVIACGNNTRLSEDGRTIVAECDGQVFLKGDKVCVSRVMSVDNVDTSTGNIFFVGSVNVRGDVLGGFSIIAGGDIIVKGSVENAKLVAGNNIILANGMNGKEGGFLKASGDIRAYFIENATVEAAGSVSADVLLNCTVTSGDKILATGKRGFLMGGSYTAAKQIFAYDVGTPAYSPTRVCLEAAQLTSLSRTEQLAQIAQYQEGINKMKQIAEAVTTQALGDEAQQATLVRAIYLKQQMENAIKQLDTSLISADDPSADVRPGDGTIVVRNNLYPKVTIEIAGATTINEVLRTDSVLRNKGGLIVTGKY